MCHNMFKPLLLILLGFFVVACDGEPERLQLPNGAPGANGNNNQENLDPNANSSVSPAVVIGTYDCESGCDGTCDFGNGVIVQVNDTGGLAFDWNFTESDSTLQADGTFRTENEDINCAGLFTSSSEFKANCVQNDIGERCPQVKYKKRQGIPVRI